VAAVHATEHDFVPLGAAVVIDDRRLLTCAHVVAGEGCARGPLWVAFPKAENVLGRRAVSSVVVAQPADVADLAVLVLDRPVPAGVTAAPLRCPRPQDLVGKAWWAFGFAGGDPVGNAVDGVVGASLGYGWVRLDTGSRYQVERGFSGSGLWSPDYEAVVGVVGQANDRGDARAITLYRADACLPEQNLRRLSAWSVEAAGELALAAWGWALETDPEAGRHWRPRARGVTVDSERGYRFRGRSAALTAITRWLDRPEPDRRVLVVTGSSGVGKSAVLGRVVTTADPGVAAELPPGDDAVRATLGSVACAVHAKGKTALEVAAEVARAASAALPDQVDDFAPAMRAALTGRGGERFNVIIDALDEAATAAQARLIARRIVLPLAETCSGVGAQVVVGTRRRDEGGDLLSVFGDAIEVIDLDDTRFFAREDLTAYATATLQLVGDERPGNPYADPAIAARTAGRIAELSGRNFLVAGLIARAHGLHDTEAADPAELSFPATVDAALRDYLDLVAPVAGCPAESVLAALAFAEPPGLPIDLWREAIVALGGPQIGEEQLSRFARSSAANFLVESGPPARPDPLAEGWRSGSPARSLPPAGPWPPTQSAPRHSGPVFRLFHQALNDALRRARSQAVSTADRERALYRAFVRYGRRGGWANAPGYLLRSLPAHAARAGMVDDLLLDDEYLLHADLRRLARVEDHATSEDGRRRARLLRLTPHALNAMPAVRAAMFSVTEALENLGNAYRGGRAVSYQARWASARPRGERTVLAGHTGWVGRPCSLVLGTRVLLASPGNDRAVRLWDPATGEQVRALHGHSRKVLAVCSLVAGGRVLLASAGHDGTVRVWDPATGKPLHVLRGHTRRVNDVCSLVAGGRVLLASAGRDRTVRVWDPATGEQRRVLAGHAGPVYGVCAFVSGSRALLASVSSDRTARVWDPDTEACLLVIPIHHPAFAVTWVAGALVAGLAVGVLAVELDPVLGAR